MKEALKTIRWKMVFRFLGVVVGLVGVVLLMGLVSKKDAVQVCQELEVIIEGKETFIDQQDISEMIDQIYGKVEGKLLQEIPTHEIEQELKGIPYVSNAEVYMDMDGKMSVKVKQREVILRVMPTVGESYYLASDGKKIPVTLKYVPYVMVANGHIREHYQEAMEEIQTPTLEHLYNFAQFVKGDTLWSNQIVQLYVNQDEEIEIIPRVGTQQFVIGTADSLASKLNRIELFYKNILPKVGNDAYNKVNVKYTGQIICERNKDWFIDSLQMQLSKVNIGH